MSKRRFRLGSVLRARQAQEDAARGQVLHARRAAADAADAAIARGERLAAHQTPGEDTARAVREVKAGRVEFKIDKAGNVHVPVGKASFGPKQIEENARAVIEALAKSKPHSVKGQFIHSCTISATMSPPVRVDLKEISTAA